MIIVGINAYHADASAANPLRPLKGELIVTKINAEQAMLRKRFY